MALIYAQRSGYTAVTNARFDLPRLYARPTPQSRNDISYSGGYRNFFIRKLILLIENITGRTRLARMADGYDQEIAKGRDFWEIMQECYGIELEYIEGDAQRIPKTGAAVVVANHPYGILDSLALGRLISFVRKDFKIVAHTIFTHVQELEDYVLPISFNETREATQMNLNSRKTAIEHLQNGGLVAIYPGGTVSTSARPFGQAIDPKWKNFTAKMISRGNADVIPVFFEGKNSRLFQIASHIHPALRQSLLIAEFASRINGPVRLAVGKPVDPKEIINRKADVAALMDYLRDTTYALSPVPLKDLSYGWGD